MAPSGGGGDSAAVPLLMSAGLFLATALASQYLQHHLKKGDEKHYTRDGEAAILSDLDTDSRYENRQKQNRIRSQRQRLRLHREQQQKQQQRQPEHQQQYFSSDDFDYEADEAEDEAEDDDRGYQEEDAPTQSEDVRAGFSDYYTLRRLEDRLSFENLRPLLHETERGLTNSQRLSWEEGVQDAQSAAPINATIPAKSNKKGHHRPSRRRHPSVMGREDENDFLPKNSNWNHFERYNEDDLKSGIAVSSPVDHGGYRHHIHQHHYQPFSSGYMHHESEKPADVVESATRDLAAVGEEPSSDTSEEPQFVWTDAVHEKKSSSHKRSSSKTELASKKQDEPIIECDQPVVMQATTYDPTIEAELTGLRNRPVRLMTGESFATVPTGNVTNTNEASSELEHQRQFLRHASSATSGSQHDQMCLPQRFPTPNNAHHLQRAESGESGRSDVSGMSNSSHHKNHTSNRNSLRSARAQYNAKIMPNKVVMIRHGQSMGNVSEALYSTTPDNAMPLTELGWDQARKAGKHLRENVLAQKESVHFIVSPYARTVETFHGIVSAWCDPDAPEFASIPNREMRLKAWYGKLLEMGLTWHEDPRIREQDFGNYQDPDLIRKAKRDRHRFGVFYYRFPHGESASDVFDRVSTFLDSLWRSFDMNRSRNYVLVTHGISIRVLLARYFRYTIHQFNMLANPRNCEMVVLGHDGYGRLRLQGRYQLLLKEKAEADLKKLAGEGTEEDTDDTISSKKEAESAKNGGITITSTSQNPEKKCKVLEVDEYRFYKRLRILPQAAIRKVDIRISYNDGASKNSQWPAIVL